MGRAAPMRHERSVSVRAQPDVPRGRIGCAWRSHRIRVAAALHLSRRPHCGLALLRCAVRGADALTTVRCGLRGVPSACRSLGTKDTVSVLSVQAVAKRFGERLVFSDVSFMLAHGDRVGLVGPNGVGKTTLLRVAAGIVSADAGNVAIARGTRVGFMEQEVLFEAAGTVEQHARGAAAHLRELEAEMRDLEPRLGSGDQELLEQYAEAQHRFEHAGGYHFAATVSRVLAGLGLDALRAREVRTLSGGERTRLGLARLLL